MRKQTRRSISLSGPLHARVRAYCEAAGISLSSLVESVVAQHLGGAPSPESHDSEEDGLEEISTDSSQAELLAEVQEVDLTTTARQEDEHVEDKKPEEQPVEREPRVAPRRPAADPALRVRSSEHDNPELGSYIPPHLLF